MPSKTFNNLPFEKKLHIYQSAINYFGKVAFENAKVSELAELMGVKRRTYYSYFSSLEDLYNYVFIYSNSDCKMLFSESDLLPKLKVEGFTDEIFDVFESYYLSIICSDYGLGKLYENINTLNSSERIILNVLVSILKQYELGILSKSQVKDEVKSLIDAHL